MRAIFAASTLGSIPDALKYEDGAAAAASVDKCFSSDNLHTMQAEVDALVELRCVDVRAVGGGSEGNFCCCYTWLEPRCVEI